jgi:hypothetical protein
MIGSLGFKQEKAGCLTDFFLADPPNPFYLILTLTILDVFE